MGKGTEESPYTRKDILRLIEENGGKAEGLNLSGKIFEDSIDLRGLQLQMINLNSAVLEKSHLEGTLLTHANFEGAFMQEAHLEGAHMSGACLINCELISAHLEKARIVAAHLEHANLFDAYLEEADLINAFLEKTRLSNAHLQGAQMQGAIITADTELEYVDWGNYVLGEEKEAEKEDKKHLLKWAEVTYRRLKIWYTEHGMHDIAAKFFYREMEAKRKAQNWKKEPHLKLWSLIMRILCGYGEKPERVVISAAAVLLAAAFVYFLLGSFWEWSAFWRSLYFSTVSFTALGYGSWVNTTSDVIRGLGAAESFLGVFMMALFLVTFTRKMTR